MPGIEANVEGAWVAKQTAKGTPASVAIKQLRKVGGGMSPNRDDGSEAFSDGKRFQDATDFVNQVIGNGNPTVQMGPGDGAYLAYLMAGAETVGAAVNTVFPHTITFASGSSFWATFWKRVGASVILRQKFNDCRITSLRIEASSANKVAKITPTFFSLDAGETYATDPVKALDTDSPFLYTEGEGTFNIDGTIMRGHSGFALVVNDNLAPWWGDSVNPYDVTSGAGTITIEGITILVDSVGLQQFNKIIYGSASPVAGTKPQKVVYMGSYTFTLTRGAAATLRSFQATLASVHWNPDISIDGTPDGGPVELALGAEARGSTPLTTVWNNLDPAYT